MQREQEMTMVEEAFWNRLAIAEPAMAMAEAGLQHLDHRQLEFPLEMSMVDDVLSAAEEPAQGMGGQGAQGTNQAQVAVVVDAVQEQVEEDEADVEELAQELVSQYCCRVQNCPVGSVKRDPCLHHAATHRFCWLCDCIHSPRAVNYELCLNNHQHCTCPLGLALLGTYMPDLFACEAPERDFSLAINKLLGLVPPQMMHELGRTRHRY